MNNSVRENNIEKIKILINQKRPQLAIEIIREILAQNPDDAHAHILLARCLIQQKKYKDALVESQKAVGLQPNDAYYLYIVAFTYARKKELKKATQAIEQSLALSPKNADYLYQAALIEYRKNRIEYALEKIEKVLQINPEYVDALDLKAYCLRFQGQHDAALEILQNLLKIAPNNAAVHTNLGWSFKVLKRYKEAESHFKQALQINPNHTKAPSGLKQCKEEYFLPKLYRFFEKLHKIIAYTIGFIVLLLFVSSVGAAFLLLIEPLHLVLQILIAIGTIIIFAIIAHYLGWLPEKNEHYFRGESNIQKDSKEAEKMTWKESIKGVFFIISALCLMIIMLFVILIPIGLILGLWGLVLISIVLFALEQSFPLNILMGICGVIWFVLGLIGIAYLITFIEKLDIDTILSKINKLK